MRLKNLGVSTFIALALVASAATSSNVRAESPAPANAVETVAQGEHAAAPVDPVKEELDYGTLLVTIVIFVGLVIVLRFTAWKPILSGLQAREAAIRDSVEAAKRAKEDAERTTKELESKMAEVQRQAAQQLQQAKTDALKVADSIRQQAETDAAALKDRTLREIDGAKQEALSAINSYAAELGTSVASKILRRSVTADDQQRLVEESLAEMAKKN